MSNRLQTETIRDFGRQWTAYAGCDGFFGSLELFQDMFAPLLSPDEVRGCRVAEIGSGAGRIVRMLLEAGAAQVLAIEPSAAFQVLSENTKEFASKVTLLKATGDRIPPSGDLDYVFSCGVLHHIPDPAPVVRAAFDALRPGGRFAVWLYGKEGNRLYLSMLLPLRAITTRLSHRDLEGLAWLLSLPLGVYIYLCKVLPLPLRKYMVKIMGRLSPEKRRLNIYDQLNPAYAKYYARGEAVALMKSGGFEDIAVHHRHGYSWSVVGTKPGLRS